MQALISGEVRQHQYGTISLEKNVGTRSTIDIEFVEDFTALVELHASIEIQKDDGTPLYKGFVLPTAARIGNTRLLRINVTAIDHVYRIDKRTLRQVYTATTAGAIVQDIIDELLYAEGITAGTITAGAAIDSIEFIDDNVGEVLQHLAEMSGYIWYLDLDRALHFVGPGDVAAPRDLYFDGEIMVNSSSVGSTGADYANRVRIRGRNIVVDNLVEQARLAALEDSSGIVEVVLEDRPEDDATATARAQAELDERSQVDKILTFSTRTEGFDVGQTLTAYLPEYDLDDVPMLIRHIVLDETSHDEERGILYTVECWKGPKSAGAWNRASDALRKSSATDIQSSVTVNNSLIPSSFSGLIMRADPINPTTHIYIEKLDWASTVGISRGDGWQGNRYAISACLDTGAIANSTWYEVYLESVLSFATDGGGSGQTYSLRLTKAATYVSDTFVNADVTTATIGNASGTTMQAQGFQMATTGVVDFIDLRLGRVGSPTDYLKVEIRIDNGGSPDMTSGGLIATSIWMSTPMTTSIDPIRVVFFDRPLLSTGTQYWLVFRRTGANDGSNYWVTRYSTAVAYAGGKRMTYNGSAWADPADGSDIYFSTFRTIDADLQIQSGNGLIAGYAKIGYIRTNASGQLEPFIQIDRRQRRLVAASAIALNRVGGGKALTGNSTDIPPCKCWVTARATERVALAGVPDGYRADWPNSNYPAEAGGSYASANTGSPPAIVIDRFFTDFQALWAHWNGGNITIHVTETEWLQ